MHTGRPSGSHADRTVHGWANTGIRIYIYICILPLSFRWGACHYRKARALRKLFGLSPRVVHRVVRFKQQWTWCGGYRLSNRLLPFNRCRAARYLNSDGRQPGIGSNNYIVGANHLTSASNRDWCINMLPLGRIFALGITISHTSSNYEPHIGHVATTQYQPAPIT